MLQAGACVVTLHDVTEVIYEWLDAWVVLPVDVGNTLLTEGTLLGA